ncbi:DUF1566 domain-containing protein [Dysgonomonas sp. 521]|uniref:DUF1566 domain-containing protein n=1 Tax=Dysgonomonas sp. 521 TaxID=2302932 RepID=UPI0013D1C87F|nr:DUF1566 domain-containing protein [Dysgonomonas sp. 521]NDV97481.1 DUF1566 domain-containing protein [Dysgonomonas sp. 521]
MPESAGASPGGVSENKYINSIAHRRFYTPSVNHVAGCPVNSNTADTCIGAGSISGYLQLRTSNYWSSTEYSGTIAWNWNFNNQYANRNNKTNNNYVRCVRR